MESINLTCVWFIDTFSNHYGSQFNDFWIKQTRTNEGNRSKRILPIARFKLSKQRVRKRKTFKSRLKITASAGLRSLVKDSSLQTDVNFSKVFIRFPGRNSIAGDQNRKYGCSSKRTSRWRTIFFLHPPFSMSFAFLSSFYATLSSTVFLEIEIQWLRAVESTTLEKLDWCQERYPRRTCRFRYLPSWALLRR